MYENEEVKKIGTVGVECPSGKLCFSYKQAKFQLKSFKRRHDHYKQSGSILGLFHCKQCTYYHIGNSVKIQPTIITTKHKKHKKQPKKLTLEEFEAYKIGLTKV